MTQIYLIGSLRSPTIPPLARFLRFHGFRIFDDWYAAGPEADDYWQKYEIFRGRSYEEALDGKAAQHVFNFDLTNMNASDMAVLVLPAGKSGHLEFGYMLGEKKPGFILLDRVLERWDVMYCFATGVATNKEMLLKMVRQENDKREPEGLKETEK